MERQTARDGLTAVDFSSLGDLGLQGLCPGFLSFCEELR